MVIYFHLFRQNEGGDLVSALENAVVGQEIPAYRVREAEREGLHVAARFQIDVSTTSVAATFTFRFSAFRQ